MTSGLRSRSVLGTVERRGKQTGAHVAFDDHFGSLERPWNNKFAVRLKVAVFYIVP